MIRVALLALFVAMSAQGETKPVPVWNAAARDAWWANYQDPKVWRVAASSIKMDLIDSYQPSNTGELSPDMLGWFNHIRWVSRLSADEFAETGLTLAEFKVLGENEVLQRTFLNEISAKDNPVEAFKILGQLYRAAPQDVMAYPALATAFALVFDQPFPSDWPHAQVKKLPWTEKSGTPAERFAYYVDLDKRRKLDFSLADLSFTELKFVVDSLVSTEEMTWARDEVRINVRDFENLFATIRYDYPRAKNQQFDWPTNVDYSLQEIQKLGGICVDQAYYGSTVGKARGIPTLYFSGQGADGGHAWYGYLQKNRSWNLDVGRYASQNYPVGDALDPQTWEKLNDAQLKQFSDVLQSPRWPSAEMLFIWARYNRNQPFYHASIEQVRTMVPAWIQGWRAEAEWMTDTKQPLEVQKEFYRKWNQQFLKFPDYKVEGQSKLLEVLVATGDTEGAKQVQTDIVRQNRRKRFDIGISAGMEPILELLDKQDWKGAENEYKKLVRQFDDKGGGNLFYGVVQPFVAICMEEKQNELAKDALEFANKKMKPQPESILLIEFDKLSSQVGIGTGSGRADGRPKH